MANDRLYRKRRAYAGEHKDAKALAGDLNEEFSRLGDATTNIDKDIDTAQTAADAAQSTADGLFVSQQDGAQKTDAGTSFAPTAGVWTDLPETGGGGSLEKTITVVGGTVKVSLTVNWQSSGNANEIEIRLLEDGTPTNQVAGTHMGGFTGWTHGTALLEIFSPTAGDHTYKAQGRRRAVGVFTLDQVDLTVIEVD